jgi:uncharacterized protein
MVVPAASLEPDNELAEVLVATTWDCNLRCSYCFVQEQGLARAGERMSPEVGVRLIDVLDEGLRDVRSVCVHLYGGEPLTNLPVMAAMLERAADKPPQRFQFAITTNGTVLTDEAIRLLGKGSFQVVLSIDGPARIHDECRRTRAGEATHARVLEFLCALRSRTRCRVRGSAVVRSGWSLAEAVGYLRGLPVDTIKAQAVRGPEGTAYALSPGERDQYLRDLETIGREVISELEQGQLPKDDRFSARVLQLLAGMSRERFCAAGDTTFGITPAGGVFPCTTNP